MLSYSFIIPVYNRPDEIRELLSSFTMLGGELDYEILIVEDGSEDDLKCDNIVKEYSEKLPLKYFYKKNSGPGDSRNFGMGLAKGDYFLILDSDVLIPHKYLIAVDNFLKKNEVDVFGGPDAAHDSFSNIQKAINYSMTSMLTTGGIRGKKNSVANFQPRSFNMGIKRSVFQKTGGYNNIYPGEDTDFSLRIKSLGYKTALIAEAFVFHKRRVSWSQFSDQVYKFGTARPILNNLHKGSSKLAFWFPSVFLIFSILAFVFMILSFVVNLDTSAILLGFSMKQIFLFPIIIFSFYFILVMISSTILNKSLIVGILSVVSTKLQFFNYGRGFLYSFFLIKIKGLTPNQAFPEYFNRF
jgi:glycosyltransferase involved in cell wall biosynthesis